LDHTVISLERAEYDAAKTLEPELHDHIELSARSYDFVSEVLTRAPEGPLSQISQSRKVVTVLLLRIASDLRCIGLVALRGYPEQACVLAASVYEAAFTVMVVGSDDVIAQGWVDYDDPNRQFRPILELTREGLRRVGADPVQHAQRWYTVYRQLCLPKHLNPVLQRLRGLKLGGSTVTVQVGPDAGEDGVRLSWFALEKAAGLAIQASAVFAGHHLAPGKRKGLPAKKVEIERIVLALNERAANRWGYGNPYPEKWKS
jgi:hypothetical protein